MIWMANEPFNGGAPSPRPSPPWGEGVKIRSGNHRLVQVARPGARKLFDARRRGVFLEWFAATCNAKLSCEKAGITQKTAFRHRRKDPAFAVAWEEALQQGYAALEASLVAEALASSADEEEPPHPAHAPHESPSPARGEGLSFEQRMAVLREYRRSDGGRGPRGLGKSAPVPGRIATAEEVETALI